MQSVALRPREARRKSPPALRTLVLNADYRPLSTYPLSIIAAQDAVSAIWRERVDVVEAWPDAFFRSPSTTIAVVPLPEPALAAVLRILSKPVDEPITNNAENLSVLHLLAYIAGASIGQRARPSGHPGPAAPSARRRSVEVFTQPTMSRS